jgi:hypothetical protein
MLDTPNFFWDSEPTLHPLYQAVREYLEIKPRIQVLNERCKVFLDLAEMLNDSIADVKMTRITWIIIILIIISILVTCTEVFLRFGILASGRQHGDDDVLNSFTSSGTSHIDWINDASVTAISSIRNDSIVDAVAILRDLASRLETSHNSL